MGRLLRHVFGSIDSGDELADALKVFLLCTRRDYICIFFVSGPSTFYITVIAMNW